MTLFKISSVYLFIVGAGFLIAPDVMMFGALGAGISPFILSTLRGYGGVLIAVGTVNWMSQNVGPSRARTSITVGNLLGFGAVAVTGILGILGGGPPLGWLFTAVNAGFASAFYLHWKKAAPTA